MLPRLIQWKPFLSLGEVLLLPREGSQAGVSALAGGAVTLVASRLHAYVQGVNIDGGDIDLGDGGEIARLSGGSIDELAAAATMLAPLVEPACFVVREGARGHLVVLDGSATVTEVADWTQPLREDGSLAEVCEALSPVGPPSLERLAQVEELAQLCPEAREVQATLGWLLMRLDRHAEALAPLERAIAMEAPDHVQAYAWANLAYSLDALGRSAEAVPWYERAVEARRVVAHKINLGMTCAHAGRFEQAWNELRPFNAGRRLFDAAEMLARSGRRGDVRALLRAALETDPKLLAPVPDNQWPKPPDLGWIDRADWRALVDAARAHKEEKDDG
jgi:tetratricopeptide (TPR) repeat protein